MTRAKDISKILTDADLSGTLDVTGTITVGDGHTIGNDGADNLHLESSTGEGIVLRSPEYVSLISGGTPSALVANNGDISFYEDTGTTPKLFWDSSAESLTIGTATITPNGAADDLVIAKSGSTGLNFISGTSDAQTIAFGDTSDSLVGSLQYFHSDDHMEFTVNNAEAMRIDSSGNVGIGTGSPTVLDAGATGLHLHGDTRAQFHLTSSTTGTAGTDGLYLSYDGANGYLSMRENQSIIFQTNTAERMRIDNDGFVAIGQSDIRAQLSIGKAKSGTGVESVNLLSLEPTGTFAIGDTANINFNRGSTTTARISGYYGDDNVSYGELVFSTRRYTTDALNEGFRLDNRGRVGIGTASPTSALDVRETATATVPLRLENNGGSANTVRPQISMFTQGTNGYHISTIRSNVSNDPYGLAFVENATERMRIDSSGNVLVGTTSTTPNPGISLQRGGTIGIGNSNGNSGTNFMEFRRSATQIGAIQQSGTTGVLFQTSSDYRLKENVAYDFDATTRLKQLKPCRFNFIAEANRTVDGFIAHEVSSVVPEAITGTHNEVDDDGNPVYQGIDQSKLVPLLVKTIQELEARITALETA